MEFPRNDELKMLCDESENKFIPSTINENKNKLSKLYLSAIDIDITDKCNLNCAGCNHLSSLTKDPFFYDIIQLEKDVKRMSELFIIGMVRVLGGEPFLHPQLHSCVDIVLKYFQHSQIVVFTNGLLVDKIRQFHELYPTIQIHQSVYPPVERIFDQKSTSRLFINQGINLNGDSDIVVARSSCSCKHSYSL